MNTQIPILFVGDSPSLSTGLARIGRDLATQLTRLPQYRVAYLGRGLGAHTGQGIADSRLPFMQYTYQPTTDNQWGARELPDVWRNWAGGERGVIFTVWDPSRLTWFGNPLPMGSEFDGLYQFLTGDEFERWGYFAIDAEGPGEGGALAPMLADTLWGYDKIIAYSRFGQRVIQSSLGVAHGGSRVGIDWMPHGYNASTFQPRDRTDARLALVYTGRLCGELAINPDAPVIGCVMSNQPRKDWGLWARSMQLVAREIPNLVLWAHTDSIDRHWDLRMLLDTFGLANRTIVTTDSPSDVEMSWRYSACDLTVLPSLGEGWGYSITESHACDVPTVHINYAAGAEQFLDNRRLALPVTYQLDTRYCVMRPVVDPGEFAARVTFALQAGYIRDSMVESVMHLRWTDLWPRVWQPWFERAAHEFESRNRR